MDRESQDLGILAAQRLKKYALFLLGGGVTTSLCMFILMSCPSLTDIVLGAPSLTNRHPQWANMLHMFVVILPWLIGGGILILAIVKKQFLWFGGYVTGAVIPYACVVAFLYISPIVDDYSHRIAFDSAGWRTPDSLPTVDYVRLRMVDDFLATYGGTGMSKTELEALLGPPDKTPYFSNWDMVYYLGPERGAFGVDSEWLVLNYNEQQMIDEVDILTD